MSVGDSLPIIDVSGAEAAVAAAIRRACLDNGFFYVVGHGVSEALQTRLEEQARIFFALPVETKMKIRMELAGRAWRGYFPVGDELTSGKPDLKEGIYFGEELGPDDPRVHAGTPLHGPNLFPVEVPGLRDAVLAYMAALTGLGHALMRGVALSLGLEPNHFRDGMMARPLTLFRVFHYPAVVADPGADEQEDEPWGVGEHTDYGVLTILRQDDVGGLQVRSGSRWIEAPPVPGSFVCNIGDMLDRLTRGVYRSTPHRVRNTSGRGRLSFPFFFDPGWDARVEPIEIADADLPADDREARWDRASVHDFSGTYGDYVRGKVAKVFPELGRRAI